VGSNPAARILVQKAPRANVFAGLFSCPAASTIDIGAHEEKGGGRDAISAGRPSV
jgi:hypothetical protein